MYRKNFKFIEPFILSIIIVFFLVYVVPIFVTIPNKAIHYGAINYINAMNKAQKQTYEKTGKFLTSLSFLDLDLGYQKEGGKPDGKLIPIDPNKSMEAGYIKEIKSGFANKHHKFLSYINNHTAWNLAIPTMTYNFGNTNYFFWVKNIPHLDSYVGVIHQVNQNLRTSEQFRCTIDAPAKIPQLFINGKVTDLTHIEDKTIVENTICKTLAMKNTSLCRCVNLNNIN